MKNVCLFFLMLLLPMTGKAGSYEDISSLRAGDWIRFEIVGYYPLTCYGIREQVPWRTENIRTMVLKATVVHKTEQELSLGYTLEYFTDCMNDSVNPGFYYYDSRYRKDFSYSAGDSEMNLQKLETFFINHPDDYFTRVTYDIQTGDILSTHTAFEDMHLNYSRRYISRGVEVKDFRNSFMYTFDSWNMDALPQVIARSFIAGWASGSKNQSGMPMKIVKDISSYYSAETRVIDASFLLPPNIRLSYTYPGEKTKKQKTENHAFFSASPQRFEFAGQQWLVMPGDSIVLTENEKGEYSFFGKGSAANNFMAAKAQKGNLLQPYSFANSSSQRIETHLENWTAAYGELYDRYAPEMDPFWKASFKQTQWYYQDYIRLMDYVLHAGDTSGTSSIDWNSESFSQVSPFTDYILMPGFYGEFLNSFVQYKASQLAGDNLTAIKTYWGNNFDLFHLQRLILAGYPRFKANADVLETLMRDYTLQDIKREYDEFIADCPNTPLIKQVEEQHELLMKIEPGTYIQHSGLELTKEIPLQQGKEKSYTLLNLSLLPATYPVTSMAFYNQDHLLKDDNSIGNIENRLKKNNLSERVRLCFYRPEPEKEAHPSTEHHEKSNDQHRFKPGIAKQPTEEDMELFRFLPEKQLARYICQAAGGGLSITLLVRNDGKIMFRSLDPFEIPVRQIIELIQEDLNKQEPATAGSSFWLRFLFSALTGGLTVFIWGKIKQRKEKSKRLMAQLEMKALRSQMNPHFIFNALNSIQNLINRSEAEQANRYLLTFAKLLRRVLSSSEKKLVPLAEEIEQLRLYINLEQLRFPFEADIQISDSVDTETTEIPGMLIQPLVENAIKHGIAPRESGKIEIRFECTGTMLKISVADNGPGIRAADTAESRGFGLKSVRERIKLLQGEYHTAIDMQIENKENPSGCRITLSIPVE